MLSNLIYSRKCRLKPFQTVLLLITLYNLLLNILHCFHQSFGKAGEESKKKSGLVWTIFEHTALFPTQT